MEATRARSRRGRSPNLPSARRPATRSTARVVAKAVPLELVEKSLRETALRTCGTPAASAFPIAHSQVAPKSRSTLAAVSTHMHSITPPSSRQGTPESVESGPPDSVKSDPCETKQLTTGDGGRIYPTPPPAKLLVRASSTLRECCCHAQTNVSTFEALTELKDVLIAREGHHDIDENYMARHPKLEPRMRRILFDWLMEVSEVMILRRETFHLAANLFDRYMSLKSAVKKEQLQLIGVTCLFISGKLEEIYPPRASAFAYVTDHLVDEEIRTMELDILVCVHFQVNAVTANTWVALWVLYMHTEDAESTSDYDTPLFVRTMELVDLAICDTASIRYSNRTLALAAFYLVTRNWTLPATLGFRFAEVQKCAEWLTSFFAVMNVYGSSTLVKSFDEVPENEALNIQDHKYCMEDFLAAQKGPKQPVEAPAEDHLLVPSLTPESLSFNSYPASDYLTPTDNLSQNND